MTEYDYSPEAYERFLATQNRIANWVDKTEQHRSQFENALSSVPTASQSRPGPTPLVPNHRSSSKRSPPSSLLQQHSQQQHGHRPRELFIPPHSPASESSDDYGDGPGPMPMTSPGMMMYPPPPQQPAYQPMAQPMMSPPLIMVPPSYPTTPHHKSSHHRYRPAHPHPHSHSRSYSQQPQAYYSMASPPISPPAYQYSFPQMSQGAVHPGYIMMPPHHHQQQPFSARPKIPVMSGLPEPPRSAIPNQTLFPELPASTALVSSGAGDYLHPILHTAGEPSAASTSPSLSPRSGTDTTGNQPHHFSSIPQYQGIHSATGAPPHLNGYIFPGPSQPNGPQNLQRHFHDDLIPRSRHHSQRSVG